MSYLKTHSWALVLSVLVSVIYGSHHIFIPYFLGEAEYFPVTATENRDEGMFYGPRANSAFYGDLIVGDINLSEYKESPAFLPMLNPLIMGWLGKVIGSLKFGFIVSDFLFPALIFLVLYFLAFELIQMKTASSAFASLFIFLPKLFLFPSPESYTAIFKIDSLYFSRFEYPKITYLFYVSVFFLILRAIKMKNWLNIIFGGFGLGILFYTYLYDWMTISAALIICFFTFLLSRNYAESKIVFCIGAVAFLTASFYWVNLWNFYNWQWYGDIFSRIGVELGNSLRWSPVWKSYLRNMALISVLFLTWRKKDQASFYWIFSLLAAYFFVVNIQVIAGFNPQPDHWHRVQFLPVAMSFLLFFVWVYENYFSTFAKRFFPLFCAVLILVLFTWETYAQFLFSRANASAFSIPASYTNSYKWLNKNTSSRSVVVSLSAGTSGEVLLYTHNKAFLANGFNSSASNAEILKRFFIASKIFGLTADEAISLMKENGFYLFHDLFRDHSFNSYFAGRTVAMPNDFYETTVELYKNMPENALADSEFRADYIYFGPREREVGKDPKNFFSDHMEKVYENNGVIIYHIL